MMFAVENIYFSDNFQDAESEFSIKNQLCGEFSDKPAHFKSLIKPVVFDAVGDDICVSLDDIGCVAHSYACPAQLKHFYIVPAVAYRNGIFDISAAVSQHLGRCRQTY